MTQAVVRVPRYRAALGTLALLVILGTTLVVRIPTAAAHTPHDPIGHIALSPEFANDETIFVISQNRILRSRNAGTTWRELNRGFASVAVFTRFAIAPSDKKIIYLASRGGGIYRSDDEGSSWSQLRVPPALN